MNTRLNLASRRVVPNDSEDFMKIVLSELMIARILSMEQQVSYCSGVGRGGGLGGLGPPNPGSLIFYLGGIL